MDAKERMEKLLGWMNSQGINVYSSSQMVTWLIDGIRTLRTTREPLHIGSMQLQFYSDMRYIWLDEQGNYWLGIGSDPYIRKCGELKEGNAVTVLYTSVFGE